MKHLIAFVFFFLVVESKTLVAFEPNFYGDVYQMENDLSRLAAEEGILKKVLENQVKRIVHRFMNDKMRSEDLARHFEFELTKAKPEKIEDVIRVIKDFLIKVYGSKAGKVIIMVLGMEEMKKSIENIFIGMSELNEDPTCEIGFKKIGESISYITGYVAVMYAFYGQLYAGTLAQIGGFISKEACKLIINVTDLDVNTCNWIHRRNHEIFSY